MIDRVPYVLETDREVESWKRIGNDRGRDGELRGKDCDGGCYGWVLTHGFKVHIKDHISDLIPKFDLMRLIQVYFSLIWHDMSTFYYYLNKFVSHISFFHSPLNNND